MLQVWFKKAEEVSKIVKTTTTTIITTTITERNSAWSVQTLRTDMRNKFSELVDGLKKEQQSYFQEEEDRIKTLSTLEQAHEELKGEHANDLADGKKISERQVEFKADLQKRRQEIEAQKKQLQERITNLQNSVKKIKDDITKGEQENKRLQKIVDTPEDLKEKGLSAEAKKLREENEKLRKQQDTLTQDLLKERDARNNFINEHRKVVLEYNKTIESYNTNLLAGAQDIELIKNDLNQADHNNKLAQQWKFNLNKQKLLLDEEITLKQGLLEQMKKDYE